MMSVDKLTALNIAEHQLMAALRMWKARDYLCAITLAGVAEEILGKRLRRVGIEPSFDNMKAAVLKIAGQSESEDPYLEKDVALLINKTKNQLKHYSGDEVLEIDLRKDAEEILDRAIANYQMLNSQIPPEMINYWSGVNET